MNTLIKDNKFIIELDLNKIDEDIMSFLSFYETKMKSKATEEDIEELAEEIKENWWKQNKKRFIDEDNY